MHNLNCKKSQERFLNFFMWDYSGGGEVWRWQHTEYIEKLAGINFLELVPGVRLTVPETSLGFS